MGVLGSRDYAGNLTASVLRVLGWVATATHTPGRERIHVREAYRSMV